MNGDRREHYNQSIEQGVRLSGVDIRSEGIFELALFLFFFLFRGKGFEYYLFDYGLMAADYIFMN